MKIVIAPDSFKGSLTAKQVAEAIRTGVARIFPQVDYELVPMADGGEGTVQSLVDATQGRLITKTVHNPLDHGVKKIILGIGGSATNDGGAGMAQALGARLLDAAGNELPLGGGALDRLDHIDISGLDPRIQATQVLIASDVTNPLTGKDGASAVFGPQKGATPAMVEVLDQNLHHYAEIIKRDLHQDLEQVPGAGAAGGLGTGLMAFTNSQMARGIDLVVEFTKLKERAVGADLVLTGEGGIDFQTKFGKTPYGVALATKTVAPQAPVVVLAGNVGQGIDSLYGKDAMDAIFATPTGAKPLAQAIADGPHDIALAAENVARLIKAVKN
ncbi:glycerate kinase [Limosilactobacillus antri]|uniref:Glycerate kinase n=1 Tax=Limosilactobacillus antri DSM 16041 TaxID=525309 RepID=C8P5T9_9LACO|nr:glycerate kinase [Limosilactobacillus antri]EEW54144.1 glycerate kinase [Limosilactobacillus antri DSM 16041]KRK59728.1 glycerate kinase [Limosilactobacillus antri DSM 16041]